MEELMNDVTTLADSYIAAWNETDMVRRRALIACTWSEAGSYVDPQMRAEGPANIDRMIEGVQARFPGHCFRRVGVVDAHNGRVRFAWELAPGAEAPAIAAGTDFAVLDGDGRLQSVTGFLDRVTGASATD
jgi:hypothetical protein